MATQNPMPFLPPKSTTVLLESFDPNVYNGSTSSVLYRFLDALCGNTGVGQLLNTAFYANMAGALQTIYFNDLDYIFGKVSVLARAPSESYPYNPMTDPLTSYEWDEVMTKDAWYRARIVDFFKACNLGGTPDGIRMGVQAAIATDCDIYEVYRYRDDFSITGGLGRTPYYTGSTMGSMGETGKSAGRNEVVVQPHKTSLSPGEMYLLRGMLDRFTPVETIVTINVDGLAVRTPVNAAGAAASSTYFEVQKLVTATPVLSQMPPPQMLPINLLPSQTWLFQAQNGNQVLAPYAAFNNSQQSSLYYLVSNTNVTAIDSVVYNTIDADGNMQTAQNYQAFSTSGQLGPFAPWPKADSPDNYPGGKYGMHPATAPAINSDGTPYSFPYPSQQAYIAAQSQIVTNQGGTANQSGYQLPVQSPASVAMTFYPSYAVATTAPANPSTVTVALTAARGQSNISVPEVRDPINFVNPVLPTTPTATTGGSS